MNNNKRITISISQVAPLIGLDNYNNFPRIVCEIWRRYNPEEFRNFELRLKDQGAKLANASELNDIWEMDELYGTNILDKVKELNANRDKTSKEMVKLQDEIIANIKKVKDISQKEIDEISLKICSVTNKMHGVNNEDNILAEFSKLCEKTIINTQGWVEIPLGTSNLSSSLTIEWLLIGKYDGITTENELVEAKMRQKGLFKRMRDYENVQVQLYLRALGFKNAYLIEGFTKNTSIKTDQTNKSSVKSKSTKKTVTLKDVDVVIDKSDEVVTKLPMQIYVHEIQYDECYVNEIILERLIKFKAFFEMFIENDKMKEEVLSNDPKRIIYHKYLDEYLDISNVDF